MAKAVYGIGEVTDTITDHVLDFEILSKYLQEYFVTTHHGIFQNSANLLFGVKITSQVAKIILTGPLDIWQCVLFGNRSVELKRRYTTVLLDGEANTYQYLFKNNVYCRNVTINKEEFIIYVVKNFGNGAHK